MLSDVRCLPINAINHHNTEGSVLVHYWPNSSTFSLSVWLERGVVVRALCAAYRSTRALTMAGGFQFQPVAEFFSTA
jgi:hypothetical protein